MKLFAIFFVVFSSFYVPDAETTEQINPDYLTPQMFNAVGDGKKDDTDALRRALYESSRQGKILYFPSGFRYRVTGTLNYYNGKYLSYELNLLGCIPIQQGSYVPKQYGGIQVAKGVKLFRNATISGSIQRMCITGQRDENVHFFNNCDCKGLVITESNISNFGALFYDSKLRYVSSITHNTFLTLYYFSRNDKTSSGMTDSNISFNYINGGAELNNNSCFEWAYYNGDTISNNFIDYFRTIYYPKAISLQSFVGPLSYCNQYQVFRYFYEAGPNINTFTFSSNSDSFNWNDPQSLDKIAYFEAHTYVGKDGKAYEIPPYIACCASKWNISIQNAKIEGKMNSLVFISSSITEYDFSRFDVSFIGNNKYKPDQIKYRKGADKPFYNNKLYYQNKIAISGLVEVLDKLPNFGIGWSSSIPGRTVSVNGHIYKAVIRPQGNHLEAIWLEMPTD